VIVLLGVRSILRLELWRSNARWLALLMVLATLNVGSPGRGLTSLALDQRQAQFQAIAVAMGAAAWYARRDRRSRMGELLATTARPRWQRVLPGAAALAIAAVVAYLVSFAIGAGLVVAAGGYLTVVAIPIVAVGALGLLAPVALGLVAGRWLPFALIPPLLIVVLAATLFFGDTEAYTDPPGWLLLWGSLQGGGVEPDFSGVTARTHLGQALWMVALAAGALILCATASLRTRAAAIVPVVLGAALAVPLLPDRYVDAYRLDPAATAPVCTSEPPRVCTTRAHEPALPALRGPAGEVLAILAAKLPDPPTSVVEVPYWFATSPPPARADTVYVALILDGDGRDLQSATGTVPDLRWEMLLGAGTPGCADGPGLGTPERRRYEIARLVAAAWLLDQEPPPPAFPDDPFLLQQRETLPVYQALRELPPDEQRARVAELRAAELACDGRDRLALLTGA
jgi:hypothetical protein